MASYAPMAFTGPIRIDDFVGFLKRRDRAPGTIQAYGWAVSDFQNFLRSQGLIGLQQVARVHLEAWQDRLIAAGLRPRSRSLATTAVRQYLRWAGDHDYCDVRLKDQLAAIRVKPLQPKPLPPAHLARLVKHYGLTPTPGGVYQLQELRNRAMFFVYLSTGARVSEGLRLPRVGFERAVVLQKGGTDKLLTVPEGVQAVVREYLAARSDSSPMLFVTHPGERPMQPGAVRDVWQRVSGDLGITPFTTHALRHTFATQLLARGVDIRIVAELMGHKNMQSVMGYTEVMEESRQRAMMAIADAIGVPAPDPISNPNPPADPRAIQSTGRGRPRFQIVGGSGSSPLKARPLPASPPAATTRRPEASRDATRPVTEAEPWSTISGLL